MGRVYLKYSKEFRETALRRLALAPNVTQLCRELGISRQLLYHWRDTEQRERQKQLEGVEQRLRRENAELKKALLKRTLEVDFLKAACAKVEAQRRTATGSGATASGKRSGN
ncbi:MAG TPA: transposase [Terracidiphilus sp.]|nr:transposase [Terracidiphilus sp.]